jgi:uncharacterized protein (TIGR00251 family)
MSAGAGAPPITTFSGGVRINVHAQPGAKRTEVSGLHGDAIKIRIQAPPLEGRANDELIRFLAEALGVARSQVTLFRGDKSRTKVFAVAGVTEAQVRNALLND